ncbi:hypothetical protein H6F93_22830 [Leptolyngbya sp. FACHB-671]|nr:hypothetical protein [Leptolyngbya sp. FACHB-671]
MNDVRNLVVSSLRKAVPSVFLFLVIGFLIDSSRNREIDWIDYACIATTIFLASLHMRLLPPQGFLKSMVPFLVPLAVATLIRYLLFNGELTWIGYIWFIAIFVTVSLPFQVWRFRTSNT